MGAFSTSLSDAATSLLTNFGESVTFERVTEGSYNPSTSDVGASTTTTFTGYGHPGPFSNNEIDGELIRATDISLITKVSTEPQEGDTVTLSSTEYRVMSVTKLRAQGVNIVYRVQLRI